MVENSGGRVKYCKDVAIVLRFELKQAISEGGFIMKIKTLTIAAMLIVAAVALTGCAGPATPATTATPAPAATDASVATPTPVPVVTEPPVPAETEASAPEATAASAPAQVELTVEELAAYDGQNGKPAYVAVNGVIYDVTNVPAWKNGTHNGYQAGKDLTDVIGTAPHKDSVLKNLTVVGKLK